MIYTHFLAHDLQAQISGMQVVLKISFENGTPYTTRPNATAEEELGLRIAYNFIGQVSKLLFIKKNSL